MSTVPAPAPSVREPILPVALSDDEDLPSQLANPSLNAAGMDRDGWGGDRIALDLAQLAGRVVLAIRGMVPFIDDRTFVTQLSVLVDGAEIARTVLDVGVFEVRLPVPPGPEHRRVEIRFSAMQRLPAPDRRRVAARIHFIGFERVSRGNNAPRPSQPTLADLPPIGGPGGQAAAPASLPPPPARILASETIISPSAAPLSAQLRELWTFRHLFTMLVWRNIRVEFDATRLGSLWAVARPVLFAVVFGYFRHLSGANVYVDIPYVPYVYSGLLLWTYFTDVATNAASAIRLDSPILSKVYYPRLLTPLVPVVSNLVTLAVGIIPLTILMAWTGVHPGPLLLMLPLAVVPCIMFALGLGLIVSGLSIEDRDWERALVYSLTIGLWLAPVIYAPEMIPGGIRDIYHLNPMSGTLLAFRAVLFAGVDFPLLEWTYSFVSSLMALLIGVRVFRSTELRLVDRL